MDNRNRRALVVVRRGGKCVLKPKGTITKPKRTISLRKVGGILALLIMFILYSVSVASAMTGRSITEMTRTLFSEYANVTITALPIFHPPTFGANYTVIYFPNFVYKDGDFRWPQVSGATEYMLRGLKEEYPKSIVNGQLYYQGTALKTYTGGELEPRMYYTLFFKDSGGHWQYAYHQNPLARNSQ